MAHYLESGLSISFSFSLWKIRQYDLHTYYKGMSGRGLKGADFVGLYKKDRLVIIEVKNYRYDSTLPPDTEKVVDEMYRKTEDTLIGLDAIRQMLERKWLYRNLSFILPYLPARSHDWPFWFQVSRLLRDKERISLLLILEGLPENQRKQVKEQLRPELAENIAAIHVYGKDQVAFEGLNIEGVREI